MPRAHIYKVLQNGDGSILTGASVRVLADGSSTNLTDPLFTTDVGSGTLTNPFTSANGKIEFYLDNPQRIQIGVTPPGSGEFFITADALPDALYLVIAGVPQLSLGTPVPNTYVHINSSGQVDYVVGTGGGGGVTTLAALTDVAETSPADEDVLTFNAATSKWGNQATPPGIMKFLYGDGSDGVVVFDGTSTVLGMVPSANVYTLNREVAATNLTVNAGVTVVTNNFRLFANGTLTNNGIIQNDAGNGINGLAGGLRAAQVLAATAGGGAGATGVGANGSAQTTSSFGGNGGNGGAGVSGGGTGGSAGIGAGGVSAFHNLPAALNLGFLSGGLFAAMKGGGGGGGGGGDGTNAGGGGGAGGGIVAIYALHVVNTGTISAKGGNGAARSTGNVGGGGGGGGGAVVVVSGSAQNGTVTAAGGTPGSGVGTGAAGVAGSAGNILWLTP